MTARPFKCGETERANQERLEQIANHVRSLPREKVTWSDVQGVLAMLELGIVDYHSAELYQEALKESMKLAPPE